MSSTTQSRKSQFEGAAAESPAHATTLSDVLAGRQPKRSDCRIREVARIRDDDVIVDRQHKRPYVLGDTGTIAGVKVRVVAWEYVWNYDGDRGVIEQHYLTAPATA